jgi:hypothetical protein
MIQSAFHRTGDHSRVESCPSPRFASARASVSRCCVRPRGRRRSSDFCHYDTIVSTTHSKGRFLADAGRPCRRTVQTHDDESPRAPGDFHHPGERRAGLPSLRFPTSVLLRAGGRASRAGDDFPHPCGWLPSSARAESTEWRNSSLRKGGGEPLLDTVSSISWSPIACEGVWIALPRDEPAEDTTDVSRPAKDTNVRPHRDAFGRPSLVRAHEDCSSACSSGTREAFLVFREEGCCIGFSTPL